MSKIQQIFVVGSSRSGTTMMGRILANHNDVFTFNELHFFGSIWSGKYSETFTKKEQINLLSRLLCIQHHGLFNQKYISSFYDMSISLLKENNFNEMEVYALFLKTVTAQNNSNISCEQTPKNIYYLDEILSHFPDARVINLVRDQRDVLLSQKNKWKRKFLGASSIPISETIRAYINYHPILTSKIWNSSLSQTIKYKHNSRVKIIKYEELILNPENTMSSVCNFLNINFHKEMLLVPNIGSSNQSDSKLTFSIDSSNINKWKTGGVSDSEVYLSQKVSVKMLEEFDYPLKIFKTPPLMSVYYLILFPIKLVLAFIFNIHRSVNIFRLIKKRFL